jgi:hypothetical protein
MIESQIAAIRSSPPCEAGIVMPVIVSVAMLEDRADNVTPRRKPPGRGAAAKKSLELNPSSANDGSQPVEGEPGKAVSKNLRMSSV